MCVCMGGYGRNLERGEGYGCHTFLVKAGYHAYSYIHMWKHMILFGCVVSCDRSVTSRVYMYIGTERGSVCHVTGQWQLHLSRGSVSCD